MRALGPREQDVVIAVSASGRTPWAVGGIEAARAAGALTAAIVCATGTELAGLADLAVEVPVGAEVIAGSTRLKAGTAQKVVLNTFSTALMVRRGRTLGDLMTSMRVANGKLRDRAIRICMAAADCDEAAARAALAAAGDDISARGRDARARARRRRRPRRARRRGRRAPRRAGARGGRARERGQSPTAVLGKWLELVLTTC